MISTQLARNTTGQVYTPRVAIKHGEYLDSLNEGTYNPQAGAQETPRDYSPYQVHSNKLANFLDNGAKVEEFRSLSSTEKEELTDLYLNNFKSFRGSNHRFYTEEQLKDFVEMIDHLIEKNTGHHLVSIGSCPAWLTEGINLKDSQSISADKVAFSGSHYTKNKETGLLERCKIAPSPNQNQIQHYKQYLKTKGLDPKSIIERFRETGAKTIFLECSYSGASLKSFIDVLEEIAKHDGVDLSEFRNAVGINILANDPNTNFALDNYEVHIIDKKNLDILPVSREKFYDALVDKFPAAKWTSHDPNQRTIGFHEALARFRLMDYMFDHGKL